MKNRSDINKRYNYCFFDISVQTSVGRWVVNKIQYWHIRILCISKDRSSEKGRAGRIWRAERLLIKEFAENKLMGEIPRGRSRQRWYPIQKKEIRWKSTRCRIWKWRWIRRDGRVYWKRLYSPKRTVIRLRIRITPEICNENRVTSTTLFVWFCFSRTRTHNE